MAAFLVGRRWPPIILNAAMLVWGKRGSMAPTARRCILLRRSFAPPPPPSSFSAAGTSSDAAASAAMFVPAHVALPSIAAVCRVAPPPRCAAAVATSPPSRRRRSRPDDGLAMYADSSAHLPTSQRPGRAFCMMAPAATCSYCRRWTGWSALRRRRCHRPPPPSPPPSPPSPPPRRRAAAAYRSPMHLAGCAICGGFSRSVPGRDGELLLPLMLGGVNPEHCVLVAPPLHPPSPPPASPPPGSSPRLQLRWSTVAEQYDRAQREEWGALYGADSDGCAARPSDAACAAPAVSCRRRRARRRRSAAVAVAAAAPPPPSPPPPSPPPPGGPRERRRTSFARY